MPYSKTIVVSQKEKETLVKPSIEDLVEQRIIFSFSFFQGKSIKVNDFNNHYGNENDAKKSISDFFDTLTIISKMSSQEFYSTSIKEQNHYNEFTDNDIIDRIEMVLMEGYGMPRKKVDGFERSYLEFSFSNGKRVIATKIYGNLFEILFIDCNHLICIESARNIKQKMLFSIPGLFKISGQCVDLKEYSRDDLIDMLFEDARNNKYTSIEEFLKDYEEIKEYY